MEPPWYYIVESSTSIDNVLLIQSYRRDLLLLNWRHITPEILLVITNINNDTKFELGF